MLSFRFAARLLWRHWRAGELGVLLLALLVAVASLTAVGLFSSRVMRASDQKISGMLAADLRLGSAHPLDLEYLQLATRRKLVTAELASLPNLVIFNHKPAFATVRAASDRYPLRGRLRVADELFATGREIRGIPGPGEAWAESSLLAMLGARVGATFKVGAIELKITRVLDYRPDQNIKFAELAPTLLMR